MDHPPPASSVEIPELVAPLPPAALEAVVTPRSGTAREVLSFAAPIMLSNLSLSIMWLVDTLIMGRVGTAEQGAVGFGGTLVWALYCFFAGTMTVVNIVVAQDHGAGRSDTARHVRTALVLLVPMGMALLALRGIVPAGLRWLGAAPAIRPLAQLYIQIRLYAAPFGLGTFVLTSYLRGLGDTVTPMIVTLGANVLNAVLAVALVFGLVGLPPMGVAGAAWATAIACTVECCAYLGVFLLGRRSQAHGARELRWPSGQELGRFLALGLPIGMSWLFEMVAWTAFAAYAATRAPNELAAHTILYQVTSFCFMPAVAIGVAASTLVGRYMGAERPDLAWRSAVRSLGIAIAYAAAIGLGMVVLRRPLVEAFSPDPAVLAVGAVLALVAGCYQPFDAFGIVCQGVLRGAGKTAVPTFVMLGSGLLVFVPLVWILGEAASLGVVGAWTAALAHVLCVALVLGTIVLRGSWRRASPLTSS